MAFHSLLFQTTEDGANDETPEAPVFFADLNLDQIVDAITTGRQEYNLKPFFYRRLKDIDAIKYRHEIMRDLENHTLFEHIASFSQRMRVMREHLAQADKLYYKYQKESWFLDAVEIYCDAANCLVHDLSLVDLRSRGLLAFRDYLTSYAWKPVMAKICIAGYSVRDRQLGDRMSNDKSRAKAAKDHRCSCLKGARREVQSAGADRTGAG